MDERTTGIITTLQKGLSQHRFTHSMGVAYTAYFLAVCHGYDPEKAFLTGILHDCAKIIPYDEQLAECRRHGVELSDFEIERPRELAHAKLGAYMAEHDYHITDKEILDAIACHTVTRPEMSLLDKILYISDYTEPYREDYPGIEPDLMTIRKTAFADIDKAVYFVAGRIMDYLRSCGRDIDPITVETYAKYKKMLKL